MIIAMVLVFISPRLAFAAIWFLSSQARDAFPNLFVPALGVVFLPWTTLSYTLAYEAGEISGLWWALVAIGLVADIASYIEGRVKVNENLDDGDRWGAGHRWPSRSNRS